MNNLNKLVKKTIAQDIIKDEYIDKIVQYIVNDNPDLSEDVIKKLLFDLFKGYLSCLKYNLINNIDDNFKIIKLEQFKIKNLFKIANNSSYGDNRFCLKNYLFFMNYDGINKSYNTIHDDIYDYLELNMF